MGFAKPDLVLVVDWFNLRGLTNVARVAMCGECLASLRVTKPLNLLACPQCWCRLGLRRDSWASGACTRRRQGIHRDRT